MSLTPPVTYTIIPVDRGPITSLVTATGTVNPVMSVQIGSQVSGKIAALFVDFTAEVTKEQVLAQLTSNRFKSASPRPALWSKAHRGALAQVETAQAQLDQARATLVAAELDLDYTTISSPGDDTVISRNVDIARPSPPVFKRPREQADIGGVVEGKPARFRVDAYPKEWFEGTVSQVRHAPLIVQNVVTYDVVITVDNRHLKLKPA